MNVFYSPNKGLFKGRLFPVKDISRLNDHEDKIVVNEIGRDYHVYIFEDNHFEIEKRILDYYDLAELIKEKGLPTYFCTSNYTRTKYLMEDVRNNAEIVKTPVFKTEDTEIFTKEGDTIYKVKATIDRPSLKIALLDAYNDAPGVKKVDLTRIIEDSNYSRFINYPIVYDGYKINIPDPMYPSSEWYYILSRMYAREGEEIPLDMTDLKFIRGPRTLDREREQREALEKHIKVTELDKFDYKVFTQVDRFLDKYDIKKMCSYLTAEEIKTDYREANNNEDIFKEINIDPKNRVLKKERK